MLLPLIWSPLEPDGIGASVSSVASLIVVPPVRELFGGQVGVADHVSVGDGALIGAQAGVPSDVEAGGLEHGFQVLQGAGHLGANAT